MNLNPQSLFVGQSVIFVQEVESTNNYLKHTVKQEEVVEGTVVVTNNQTAGKGQRENVWLSDSKENGLFSILLKPKTLRPDELGTISFLVSLAVRATVQKFVTNKEVTVKWPNDIMVEDRKISGILIENILGPPIHSIVGIGLNINQTTFESLPTATSLKNETDKVYDIGEVISECLTFVEKYYLLTKQAGGVKQLWKLYVSQLYKHDEPVLVDREVYTVSGVKETGELVVQNSVGKRILRHKEAEIKWN